MAASELRTKLRDTDEKLYGIFLHVVEQATPLLESIAVNFPGFTRHDPSHVVKLELIVDRVLTQDALEALSNGDVFALLCAIWLHDTGMGVDAGLRQEHEGTSAFLEKCAAFQRLGRTVNDCWIDFVRENHHHFARALAKRFLADRVHRSFADWIGRIAESHGLRELHQPTVWPKIYPVGDNIEIHPSFLGVVLRLADILHFNEQRAPEYLVEHRQVTNAVSLSHWRAHQVATDFSIADGTCFFGGLTEDDEALGFARQFVEAADEELHYCHTNVMPLLDPPFSTGLEMVRVEARFRAAGFLEQVPPLKVGVDSAQMLTGLLGDALYANKPVWLRELMQNAYDACRDRLGVEPTAKPVVDVDFDPSTRVLRISDTGIGMTPRIVRKFLLVAGASYWSSDEYRAQRDEGVGHVGRFGVGFMSVFSVAEEVVVDSRHRSSSQRLRYVVRDARRIVRVEEVEPSEEPGTTVELRLKDGIAGGLDIDGQLRKVVKFPEFDTTIHVRGTAQSRIEAEDGEALRSPTLCVAEKGGHTVQASIFHRYAEGQGIKLGISYPKMKSGALSCEIPVMGRFLGRQATIQEADSFMSYGGVRYSQASGVRDGVWQLPGFPTVRSIVSPNEFPLEMNLSREQIIEGPGSLAYVRRLAATLDASMTEDAEAALATTDSPEERSAILGHYSYCMMQCWAGRPNHISHTYSTANNPTSSEAAYTWERFETLAKENLRVAYFALEDGQLVVCSLGEMINQKPIVFAGGLINGALSSHLVDAIKQVYPRAFLIVGWPEPNFGIDELWRWAAREYFVPVEAHRRAAYGLELDGDLPVFSLLPRPLERVGLAVADGPSGYAAFDYRDFAAEKAALPGTGTPRVLTVLNRSCPKVGRIVDEINRVGGFHFAEMGSLRSDLEIGEDRHYGKGATARVAAALNRLVDLVRDRGGKALARFESDDLPAYWDSSDEVLPFGRPILSGNLASSSFTEILAMDRGGRLLS